MNITHSIEILFKRFLPSPFAIAIILTGITLVMALLFTEGPQDQNHFLALLSYWENGIWNNTLLVFAFQMMLMLVLGHALALTKSVNSLI